MPADRRVPGEVRRRWRLCAAALIALGRREIRLAGAEVDHLDAGAAQPIDASAVTFIVGDTAMRVVRSRQTSHASLVLRAVPRHLLAQALLDHVRAPGRDAAAEREHFLDQPRADVGVLLGRHHEDRFDLRVQPPVHQRHLELELEIRHRAQAADDDLRPAALDVVDEQAVEGVDLDVRLP